MATSTQPGLARLTEFRLAMAAHRMALAALAGVTLPIAVAALMIPVRTVFASTAAALVMVAVVVAVSLWGNRFSGAIGSVSAALSFDYFLTRPYGHLSISHRNDIETTVSLFVVGLIVTEMAARGRHHRTVATEEADHLSVLHHMTEMLATGAPLFSVVAHANQELTRLLGLQGCHFESGETKRHRAYFDSNGEVIFGELLWSVSTMGLPGAVEIPVQHAGRVLGRFVLKPTDGQQVSLERRMVAVAVANQVGAALAKRRAA